MVAWGRGESMWTLWVSVQGYTPTLHAFTPIPHVRQTLAHPGEGGGLRATAFQLQLCMDHPLLPSAPPELPTAGPFSPSASLVFSGVLHQLRHQSVMEGSE